MARGVKPKQTESFCLRHGRLLPIEDFHQSSHPFHENQVAPYCKKCAHELVKYYLNKYKTLEAAIWYTCGEMGTPFIREAYEKFAEHISGVKSVNNYWGNYIKVLKTTMTKPQQQLWIDFGATDTDLKDIKQLRKTEATIEQEMEELVFLWGKDKSIEEMQFLEKIYEEYTSNKVLKPYQEKVYRTMCLEELNMFNNEDVAGAQKRHADCAKILKLNEFEGEKEKSLSERCIIGKIAMVEKEMPCEHRDQNKYKDISRWKEFMVKYVYRPMKNLITSSKDYDIEEEDMTAFKQAEGEYNEDRTQ